MKLIVAAISAVVILVACAPVAPTSPGPTSVGTAPPTDTPTTQPRSASAETTAGPTNVAQPTLGGEFPGTDATVPPNQPILADLPLDQLAGLWASLGLSCQSHRAGGPESAASYNVHCEHTDREANVDVVAEADYWTRDGVATISVSVIPSSDGSIDAIAAATRWLIPFARLAGGDTAAAWVQDHIEDSTCRQGCTTLVRGSQLAYYSGSRGAQGLFYVAPVPTR